MLTDAKISYKLRISRRGKGSRKRKVKEMLNEQQKAAVSRWFKNLPVDCESLPSARWVHNPYGVDPELVGSSSGYEWDKEEEEEARLEKALDWVDDCVEEVQPWEGWTDAEYDAARAEIIEIFKKLAGANK